MPTLNTGAIFAFVHFLVSAFVVLDNFCSSFASRAIISIGSGFTFSKTATKKPPVSFKSGWMRKHRSRLCARFVVLDANMLFLIFVLRVWLSLAYESYVSYHFPVFKSWTDHSVKPGNRFKPGSIFEQSTNRIAPWLLFNSSTTTASFSRGFKEHVLYTSLPPPSCFNNLNARVTTFTWIECNSTPLEFDHFFHKSVLFRNVPSPEHGTSHNIRSNVFSNSKGRVWASWLMTSKFFAAASSR